MTDPAAPSLIRRIARQWAHACGRLHQHREHPAFSPLTPGEARAEADRIAECEDHLTALGVEPDEWPRWADTPSRGTQQ